ncbi:MAG TPA: aminoglycoside phosphotransferase family protein, partial [Gemmatimonadales bacterium]|nr:aminoglycoside phosphotransferase family protein [Gemmatimonadales bacterium]
MKATTELPDDPALPALAAIRALGLAVAIPALGLDDRPVELTLRGYTPGSRATFEVRAGDRHFALKLYAEDPEPEAELYEALAAVGLVGEGPVRVPPLLARDRSLQVLAIGWLEGPTAQELLKGRRGERAGELAACWLRCAAALPVKVGLPLGAAHMIYNAGKEVVQLDAADRGLGRAARRLARILTQTLPKNGSRRLVHGTFYARHVLDQGDAVGVIDWERFGRGPLELDAGMFLATTWRYGLDHAPLAAEAARAEEALLAGT